MIQKETFLRVVDNSGVKFVKCLQVAKSSNSSDGKIGDILSLVLSLCKKNETFQR